MAYPDNRTMTEEEITESVVQDMDAVLNENMAEPFDLMQSREKQFPEVERTVITHKHTDIAGTRASAEGGYVGLQRDEAVPGWPTGKVVGRVPFKAEGYEALARILSGAFDQSAHGKGKQRHSNGRPFEEQPIMALARLTGIDAHAYQISKKATEAAAMFKRGDLEAAMAEFRDVIVYAAAAILLTEEQPRIG